MAKKPFWLTVIGWNWLGFKTRWQYRYKGVITYVKRKKKQLFDFIEHTHSYIVRSLSPKYPIGRLYLFIAVFVGLTVLQMPTLAIGAGIFYLCWLLERRK
jgi:hypothetical protein